MRLPWTENPPRACPFIKPDHHALAETVDPARNEVQPHVVIPTIHQLPNLPKFVDVCWNGGVRKPQVLRNNFEPPPWKSKSFKLNLEEAVSI